MWNLSQWLWWRWVLANHSTATCVPFSDIYYKTFFLLYNMMLHVLLWHQHGTFKWTRFSGFIYLSVIPTSNYFCTITCCFGRPLLPTETRSSIPQEDYRLCGATENLTSSFICAWFQLMDDNDPILKWSPEFFITAAVAFKYIFQLQIGLFT